MAETTITGLPNATTPLDGTERVPMDQNGTTVDASTQAIANLALSGLPGVVSTTTAGLAPATGFGTIAYASSVALDLAARDGQVATITLTGSLQLTTSNLANGRSTGLRLIAGASSRTLTFPTDWVFVSAKPASIPANKVARLTIECYGATNADVVADIALNDLAAVPEIVQIVNRDKLATALGAARNERVALIGLSDSNGNFGGHGWKNGIGRALANVYGCWGTGVVAAGNTGGPGRSWRFASTPGTAPTTGAPAELASFAMLGYTFLADGETSTSTSTRWAAILSANHPLDASGSTMFRLAYGTFPIGSNSHTPILRMDATPFSTRATGSTITPNTGSYGIADYTITMPAANRLNSGTTLMVGANSATLNGPLFFAYMSAENTSKASGISSGSMLYSVGGASARAAATALQGRADSAMNEYMRQIRLGLTSTNKTVVVWINFGLNDRNTTDASVGPGQIADGSSPAAYKDNIIAIIDEIEDAWIANGGTQETIHFMLIPSHPISEPDDVKLEGYRQAASELALSLPNASAVLIPKIISAGQMLDLGYYNSPTDTSHLSENGYYAIGEVIAYAVEPGNITRTQLSAIDFPSIGAGLSSSLSLLFPGILAGDSVESVPPGNAPAGITYQASGTAEDVVTVTATNTTGSAIDPDSGVFTLPISTRPF